MRSSGSDPSSRLITLHRIPQGHEARTRSDHELILASTRHQETPFLSMKRYGSFMNALNLVSSCSTNTDKKASDGYVSPSVCGLYLLLILLGSSSHFSTTHWPYGCSPLELLLKRFHKLLIINGMWPMRAKTVLPLPLRCEFE